MRCCSVPSTGLELGLILFLGFRAAIQDEGSGFPRSAARRECPLCLGFPGRLQRRTAPRGGSVGLALRRETSALASDQKLSLARVHCGTLNPGFPMGNLASNLRPRTWPPWRIWELMEQTHAGRGTWTLKQDNTEAHSTCAHMCTHTHKTYGA